MLFVPFNLTLRNELTSILTTSVLVKMLVSVSLFLSLHSGWVDEFKLYVLRKINWSGLWRILEDFLQVWLILANMRISMYKCTKTVPCVRKQVVAQNLTKSSTYTVCGCLKKPSHQLCFWWACH